MLIVAAVFMMSVQDAVFKYFSADLSLWQIFTLRGLLTLPLFLAVALVQGRPRSLWSDALQPWPLLRSLFMTLMFISFYSAIPFLGLSTVAAGIYTAPIFITLLSAYAIGEPVGARRWIAVVLGFAGVLFILQPGTDAFSLWTVLPVLGGFFYALTNVTTRSKCQSVPSTALSLSLNLALLLTGIVFSGAILLRQPADELVGSFPYLFGGWSAIGTSEWAAIALLAVLVVAIQMALAGAYQSAPPSIVATFDYSYLIFAAIWDYLFFSIVPSGMTAFGMVLIVTAGAMVIRR